MIDTNTYSGAIFSDNRTHRYVLWRKWQIHGKHVMFIGLNPSRANEVKNDLTITKLIHFAKSWGYGGIYMTNLFSIIEPDSGFIKTLTNENYKSYIRTETESWLDHVWGRSEETVFCWGNFPNIQFRAEEIIKRFGPAMCFGKTKSGAPKHPVRLGYSTKLELYE